MHKSKIKGNGRIRCFLLGTIFSAAIFGFMKMEVTRLEAQIIRSAQASEAPQTIDCNFNLNPLLENALK